MRGVAVDFHIEYVAAASQGMIGRFHFGFVSRRAVIVHRHMIGVGVIYLVCNSRNFAESLAVASCETAGETLGRSCQNRVVVLVLFAVVVHAAAHVAYYAQTQCLCFLAFAVVFAYKGDKTFRQTDEAYAQGALVYYGLDCILWFEFFASDP